MTESMIDVAGGDTVWADDSGGDRPPLVLVHPGVGDSRIWDAILPALTEAPGVDHLPPLRVPEQVLDLIRATVPA